MVVDEDDTIDVAVRVQLGQPMRDRLSVAVMRVVAEAAPASLELEAGKAQRRRALAPDGQPAHVHPLALQLPIRRRCAPKDLRVERAGEAAVARNRNNRRGPHFATLQKRQTAHRGARPRGARHQLQHAIGIWAHRLDPLLRSAQPGGGDQLHRLGQLARVRDRADAPAKFLQRGYETNASSCSTLKVFANLSSSARSVCSVSSLSSPVSRTALKIAPSLRMCSRSSSWKRGTCGTGTLSR